jgi:glycosyltransferase involved in cell wall biosynthesis
MIILFICNEVGGGWEPDDKFLRGTEDSIVNWAQELTKRGHEIHVHRNSRTKESEYTEFNGVQYAPRWHEIYADITINVKSSDISPVGPTLYLTNETNASDIDLSAYSGVIWPSDFAVRNIPVNNDNVFILPHGYDADSIYPSKKVSKQCFYASSPDRGLEHLLQIWPSVVEVHPEATLILTYGVTGLQLPNVICLGDCDEATMNEVYNTSDLWLYSCSGGELYCMVGKKAQIAGCIPVIIPKMALKETVKTGYFAKDEFEYLNLVNLVLDKPQEDRELLRKEIIKNADAYTWQTSTDVLENIISKVYTKPIS